MSSAVCVPLLIWTGRRGVFSRENLGQATSLMCSAPPPLDLPFLSRNGNIIFSSPPRARQQYQHTWKPTSIMSSSTSYHPRVSPPLHHPEIETGCDLGGLSKRRSGPHDQLPSKRRWSQSSEHIRPDVCNEADGTSSMLEKMKTLEHRVSYLEGLLSERDVQLSMQYSCKRSPWRKQCWARSI